MNCLQNATYIHDISLAAIQLPLDRLTGKSVLVTGASGLIGSCIVDMLLWLNKERDANVTIYAAGRNVETLERRFGISYADRIFAVQYDATKDIHFDFRADFVIHCASNASPDKYVTEPVDTMMSNIFGMHNILKYAHNAACENAVYVSSSEVYGQISSLKPLLETEYGSSDILSVRSSYISSKRATETLCVAFSKQYGIPVSIVRPGHVYGPTATASDNRVSSAFANAAAAGQNIEMKSAGSQIRSYCYCVDCASAILYVMLLGKCGEAYNISNKDSIITIKQMAEILATAGKVELHQSIPDADLQKQFNPMDNSSLNSDKLESLGWRGCFDANEGLCHTVQILQENRNA